MQTQQEQRLRKVQQRIKMMIKNKKQQKFNSEKDIISEKPLSKQKQTNKHNLIPQRKNLLFLQQQFNNNNEEDNDKIFSSYQKRMKSTMAEIQPISSTSLYQFQKKFTLNKNVKQIQNQTQLEKKMPSLEKIVQMKTNVTKRPSSVVNQTHRPPTEKSRIKKYQSTLNNKELQQKIRICIEKAFVYGIKLQKYFDEKHLNLQNEKQKFLNEQINVLKLVNQCKKYVNQKSDNQEDDENKIVNGAERQIIELLKKRRQKQTTINSCERISHQICDLIQQRLESLKLLKLNSV